MSNNATHSGTPITCDRFRDQLRHALRIKCDKQYQWTGLQTRQMQELIDLLKDCLDRAVAEGAE